MGLQLWAVRSSLNNRGSTQKWPRQRDQVKLQTFHRGWFSSIEPKDKEGNTSQPDFLLDERGQTLPAKPHKTHNTQRSFPILRLQQSAMYVCVICFWTEQPAWLEYFGHRASQFLPLCHQAALLFLCNLLKKGRTALIKVAAYEALCNATWSNHDCSNAVCASKKGQRGSFKEKNKALEMSWHSSHL